jgi:uncharacterized membrane protein
MHRPVPPLGIEGTSSYEPGPKHGLWKIISLDWARHSGTRSEQWGGEHPNAIARPIWYRLRERPEKKHCEKELVETEIVRKRNSAMDRKSFTGAVLASAVGAMFLSGAAFAQSSPNNSSSQSSVKCVGGNSCKGQSSCKSANNGCMGQNSCKGKGWVMATSLKECSDKGGKPQNAPAKSM